jgi:YVTN family beta-propeller protein
MRAIIVAITLLVIATGPAQADWATANMPAYPPLLSGQGPNAMAINPVTNMTYVANFYGSTIGVFYGSSYSQGINTSPTGMQPIAVAVNPVTNMTYVANYGSNNVTFIPSSNVPVYHPSQGANPRAIAVDPERNYVFVANFGSDNVTIMNGATGALITPPLATGDEPVAVALNPVTKRAFVANVGSDQVTVINYNVLPTVEANVNLGLAALPYSIAVDPVRNRIYVALNGSDLVSVIDGSSPPNYPVIATPSVGSDPFCVAVNPATNKIYTANEGSASVSVIDGNNLGGPVVAVPAAFKPYELALNPVTNKVYVGDYDPSPNVVGKLTIINGDDNTSTTLDAVAAGHGTLRGSACVAVNPVTNKIYLAGQKNDSLMVFDGATNSAHDVALTNGSHPTALAVNSYGHEVYAIGWQWLHRVNPNLSLDQRTFGSGLLAPYPSAVAVNPMLNRVYIGYRTPMLTGGVAIVGGTNFYGTPTWKTLPSSPCALAVDLGNHFVYGAVTPVLANDYGRVFRINSASTMVTSAYPTGGNLGQYPALVVANPKTHRAFFANRTLLSGQSFLNRWDNALGSPLPVPLTTPPAVGAQPYAIAVDQVLNKVFVAFSNQSIVHAINDDGGSFADSPIWLPSNQHPHAIGVNPVTGSTFIVVDLNGDLTVPGRLWPGSSSAIGRVPVSVGRGPWAVAVNTVTNKIYVANRGDNTVTAVDGATNTPTTIPLPAGSKPYAIAVDPGTGKIYVADWGTNKVTVITEAPEHETYVHATPYGSGPFVVYGGALPSWFGTASNTSPGSRTNMMGVGCRMHTTQRNWTWANATPPPPANPITWTSNWGPDVGIAGEDFACIQPLEDDAATTNSQGLGTPYAGNDPIPIYFKNFIRDVAPYILLRPRGSVALGDTVVPACSLSNCGDDTVSYAVRLRMGATYDQTVAVSGHAPLDARYVTFPIFTASVPGRFPVSCSTQMSGDSCAANDCLRDSLFVVSHDVGCFRITAPIGEIDSASAVTPACSVYNYGPNSETYVVRCRIGSTYDSSATVSGHSARTGLLVTFPTWVAGPPGTFAVVCSTMLAGDSQPTNNRLVDSVTVRLPLDVGVTVLMSPLGALDSGTVVTPACSAYNYGSLTSNYRVRLRIGSFYADSAVVSGHARQTGIPVTFPPLTVAARGLWGVTCSTALAGDRQPANDAVTDSITCAVHDIAVVRFVSPRNGDTVRNQPFPPQVALRNNGTDREPFVAVLTINSSSPYRSTISFPEGLPPGEETVIDFSTWYAISGPWVACCSVTLAGDMQTGNDTASAGFFVSRAALGWQEAARVPVGPKNKNVKDGGCLTAVATDIPIPTSQIYALKGNNRCEFYCYDTDNGTWATAESIPAVGRLGRKKAVKKGAAITTTTDVIGNCLYAAKGNNSLEFWLYNPSSRSYSSYPWSQLADIPAGTKTCREGVGMAAATVGDTACSYLLKGSGTQEFYRYSPITNVWTPMANAPLGLSNKTWKNGSCIAYDGANTIYALKGSYNEFFSYSCSTNTWTSLTTLPLIGAGGRKKKVKDGAGLAYLGGKLYAQKGGNTREFWTYSSDSTDVDWTQTEDMPVGGGKNVKGGGALTAGTDRLFAFKGNNTLEFYSYTPASGLPLAAYRSNTLSRSALDTRHSTLAVAPNPFTGSTTILLSLPRAGSISLKLYDVSGRLAWTLTTGYHPAGSSSFIVHRSSFSAGIYLLRLETDDATLTRKLIIE